MEENTQHFWHIILYYFKKSKNATERKKRFVLCMEKVLWLIERVKSGLQSFLVLLTFWPNNSLLWAVLCIGRYLAASLASTYWKAIVGDSQPTQISKSIKSLMKMKKCVFYFTEKAKWTFWPTPLCMRLCHQWIKTVFFHSFSHECLWFFSCLDWQV